MSVYGPDGQYLGPMGTPPPSLPDDEVINIDLPYQPYGYSTYSARRPSGREDYSYPPGYRYLRPHLDTDDPGSRRSRERRRASRSRERDRRHTGFEYENSNPGLRRYPVNDRDDDEPAPRYRRHRGRSTDRDRCTTCSRCADARPPRDSGIDYDLAGIYSALRSLALGESYAPFLQSTRHGHRYQAQPQYAYHRSSRYRSPAVSPSPYPPPRESSRRSFSRRRPRSPSEDSDDNTYRESQFRDDLYTINGRMMGPYGYRRGSWSEFIEIPSRGGESFDKMAARFLRMSGEGFHAVKMRKDLNSGRTYVAQWLAEDDGYYRDY
ncbi:hypothetical protein TWF696_006671 [Orbilia brochopaga]|uniref:Uncharacterized protein n=1 Tax=Orbilia brochopaga TaxID=3140254 RepID=A0AAV9UT86_9PEZI